MAGRLCGELSKKSRHSFRQFSFGLGIRSHSEPTFANPTAFAPAAQPRPATPGRTLLYVSNQLQFRAMAVAKRILPAPVPRTRTTLRWLLILKLTIFIGSDE